MTEVSHSKPMSVDCPTCDRHVLGEPVGVVELHPHPRDGPPERWTFLRCRRGGHPLLVLQERYGAGTTFDDCDPYLMYPRSTRPLSKEIPQDLQAEFEEARKSFAAKAYVAAVVMVGRTLEAACADSGCDADNLKDHCG